jgi:ATP-dependent Clp protease adaptor protein ClpS
MTSPAATPHIDDRAATSLAPIWDVVVWNDPVNLMSYVVWVFRKLFGYSESHATRLMLEVHHGGRSTVASGPLEQSELRVIDLHRHGLWATLEKR